MEGILVGCDQNQEWLLSWWWNHYCKHNLYPVAFIDFGLSKDALVWCKERGQVISLKTECPLKKISPINEKIWETRAGPILPFRSAWFKKPLGFLRSPFKYSCWIDLDCEITGSLAPLFKYLIPGIDIAIVKERDQETIYNSGVVAFRKNAPILSHFAKLSLEQNHLFMGDQDALSRAIFLHSPPMKELPNIYNWNKNYGPNPNAIIVHYIASAKVQIIHSLMKQG